MENTPNIRTQTLIWHSMESQIRWVDECTHYRYSDECIAKTIYGNLVIGHFREYSNPRTVIFETDNNTYKYSSIIEFAEL